MVKRKNTRLKTIDSVTCGRVNDTRNVQLVSSQSSDQSRSCSIQECTSYIPVVDSHNNPLIPCKISIAKRLVRKNLAIPFYKKGFFCIKLRKKVENIQKLKTVFAIDPGSKRNGYTIANEKGVIFNIQSNTNTWTKKSMENRRNYRRSRRNRKTPYRKCRFNRKIGNIPPSTKARWNCHLRILDILRKITQIDSIVIEDIQAKTKKNCKKWNKNFSPLEVGKKHFEQEVKNRGLEFESFEGWKTFYHRQERNLKKNSNKLKEDFYTHCVDSFCLAEMILGDLKINENMYILNFLQFHRRELHQGYKKGNIRRKYGSTRSLGLNRGTLVKHPKYNLTYVGGCNENRISLHGIKTGERIARNAKIDDCKILTNQNWRTAFLPGMNAGVPCRA